MTSWCWSEPDDESVQGPFPSRAAALRDASALREPGTTVIVGRVAPFVPRDYAHGITDLDWAIERLREFAADDGWPDDDSLVIADDDAEEALHAALRSWARRLTSTAWRMADDYTRETTR